jgi:hypothetical protein
MLAILLDTLFGCKHSRFSFPISVRPRSGRVAAASLTGTYVACLDCGREFPYNWQDMKVVTSVERTQPRLPALASKHAA